MNVQLNWPVRNLAGLLLGMVLLPTAIAQQNPRLLEGYGDPVQTQQATVVNPPSTSASGMPAQPTVYAPQPIVVDRSVKPPQDKPVQAASLTVAPGTDTDQLPQLAPVQGTHPPATASGPEATRQPVGVPAWWIRVKIGEQTRSLLAAQASGEHAAPPLPTLGATASRSWDRYLESFDHPIPEWFQERVDED